MSIVDLTQDLTQTVTEPSLGRDESIPHTASAVGSSDVLDITDAMSQPGQPAATSTAPARKVEASSDPGPARAGVRPSFTITDAATACAVSRKTITRKLADLAEHGAAKDEDGVWRIPVEALLAVGLHPGRSLPAPSRATAARPAAPAVAPPDAAGPAATPTSRAAASVVTDQVADVVTIPRDRWDDLRLRLARAEAEAAERALALADARLALRALTAGPSAASPSASGIVERAGTSETVPGSVPPAAGWVMGPVNAAGTGQSTAVAGQVAGDPAAAAPIVVVTEPPRRRRWWQSANR